MNSDEMKTLSAEELKKKYRELRGITYFLSVIVVLGIVAGIYLSITNRQLEYSVLALIPMGLILLQNFKKMKAMRTEIDSRK